MVASDLCIRSVVFDQKQLYIYIKSGVEFDVTIEIKVILPKQRHVLYMINNLKKMKTYGFLPLK